MNKNNNYFLHESSYVDDNVEIQSGTKIWHFSHIQTGAKIGKNCSIGQNVNIGNNVKIGNFVKIQNNVSVYEGVEIEDYDFCGPSIVFTNVIYTRSEFPQRGSEHYSKTIIKKSASIGANATIICGNTIVKSADRDDELNQLFYKLKKVNDTFIALEIEMKIWNIWSTHPTQEKLTKSLTKGSDLMSRGEWEKSYKVFSVIIDVAPNWAEGWNKRATVLYLMGKYQDSLNDIDEVLKRESRHFGALSGQGLIHIEMKNYEKAIKSYEAVQKIYPSINSAKVMIPQLKKLIKDKAI